MLMSAKCILGTTPGILMTNNHFVTNKGDNIMIYYYNYWILFDNILNWLVNPINTTLIYNAIMLF